ncbi:hypothetical protein WJX84_000762 [Apatococcus fuscideae]|uniref:Uncharacterized protein n=1 Tax=Apatococcus fuscideae TaxID=2026836 RepID=A0AAW1TJE5_9CHLO
MISNLEVATCQHRTQLVGLIPGHSFLPAYCLQPWASCTSDLDKQNSMLLLEAILDMKGPVPGWLARPGLEVCGMGPLCTKGAPLHRVTCHEVFQLQFGNPSSKAVKQEHLLRS